MKERGKKTVENFKRVTMSFSPDALEIMDKMAEEMKMSRSGFVQWVTITMGRLISSIEGKEILKVMKNEVKKLK